jgi:hypothetical protein
MARRDTAEMARRAKEAKQKKMLIALAPLLLGLLAWQGPGTFKALTGGSAPPPAAAAPPLTPAPTTGATATTASPTGLSDTDPPPATAIDRLVYFSRFTGRDPFLKTVGTTVGAPAPGQEQPSALFEINGTSETVVVGGAFPAADQTFRLVSLTADKAVVGLVTGSFEGGEATVDFAVGEELRLVGDDGTSYSVKLVSIASTG